MQRTRLSEILLSYTVADLVEGISPEGAAELLAFGRTTMWTPEPKSDPTFATPDEKVLISGEAFRLEGTYSRNLQQMLFDLAKSFAISRNSRNRTGEFFLIEEQDMRAAYEDIVLD